MMCLAGDLDFENAFTGPQISKTAFAFASKYDGMLGIGRNLGKYLLKNEECITYDLCIGLAYSNSIPQR